MIHIKLFSKIIPTFIVSMFMLALIGPVHAAPALTVNPNLMWNTFVGAASLDAPNDIVVDANGNTYIVGTSLATWGSPVRAFGAGSEGFVAKFSPSGALLWNTFLGSASGGDFGNGIALDDTGNVYVTGSSDATWGSPLNAMESATNLSDAFIAKLDSSGNLIWNTFIDVTGTDNQDYGLHLAVDANGNIYTAGGVYVRGTVQQGFTFKLNSSGALLWTKLFDSYPVDSAGDIAVDGDQDVYFLGSSVSTWGTPIRPHDLFLDAYIAKLDPADGAVVWNTFLGGNSYDRGISMVIDPTGSIYVTGESDSSWGTPLRPYTSSTSDAFVAKVNSSGGLVWNTFLGGSANDLGIGIDLDTSGNVYISGISGNWGSPLRAYGDGGDGFAAKLNSSGALVSNTFLGSNSTGATCGGDSALGTAIDQDGNAYIVGTSASSWGSPLLPYVDCTDVFVAKVDFNYPTVVSSQPANANPTNASSLDFTVTFSESVTGVTTDDFTLSTTGVTGASISGITGSGKVYTVTVNAGSGSGTIRLNVLDNDSILDANSNPLGDAGAGNGSFTTGTAYTVDRISPAVLSSVCMNQNPSSASSLSFAVTFTEAVTGVTVDDFTLFTTGVSGAGISGISSAGSVYTVTVSAGSGNGTIRLDVNDNDSIVDLASNPIGGVGNNGSLTNGVACTVKVVSSLPSPVLRSPRNSAVLNEDEPTFQWSKVVGAQTYEIEFDDAGDFNSPDGNSATGIAGTSYTVGSPFADGVPYFWHVRAVNTNGVPGKWSSVRTFTVDTTGPSVPNLLTPSGTTTLHVLTFRWEPSSSAALYEFIYDNDADCLSPIYSKTTKGTSIRPPSIPSGTYYWCVKAKDAAGNWSGLSTPFSFEISP